MEKEIMSKTIRCCRTTLLLVAAIFLVTAGTAFGATTGIAITKQCPATVFQGQSYTCTFTVQNLNPDETLGTVAGPLVVTDQIILPVPGPIRGFADGVECRQPDFATGTHVTSLAPFGDLSGNDTCFGEVIEIAPITCLGPEVCTSDLDCSAPTTCNTVTGGCVFRVTDEVAASGTYESGNFTASTTTNSPQVLPVVCDDGNLCTNDTCDPTNPITDPTNPGASLCENSAVVCDDSNLCTIDSCDPATGSTTACLTTPVVCNDSDLCTIDSCDPATGSTTVCLTTPDPTCVPNDEICRTPGFWGTHGGIEKGGPNVTGTVLALYAGGLTICGEPITTVDLGDQSAIQAICVSPKGDSNLQLARQLTAAALNCIVTNSTSCEGSGQVAGNVCGGVSIEDVFNACNAVCADPTSTQSEIGDCIGAIDCFNNGGTTFDAATDICSGDSGCHDRSLGCVGFENTGPASSPRKCNDARKDPETIF
jgi:hypothetical protein